MTNLTELSVVDLKAGLDKGDFTAVEVTQAHLDAMAAAQELNIYVAEDADQALAQAKASDARRAAGTVGALEGIPVAVKDVFATQGMKTTAASHILGNFVPTYESTVTQNFWDAGAILLGKTNMDEFAMGSSNENSAFGACLNPWRKDGDTTALTPGGSSGGSAAAVAARLAPLATGTDTGGSIRQPASYTGTVGIKPTYGRCSRWGIVAYASSLDQAGMFGRTVTDAAIGLGVAASHDPKDSTSVPSDVPDYTAQLAAGVKGKTIGIPKQYRVEGLSSEIDALWQQGVAWLKEAGATVVDIDLPHTKYALAAYYIVAPAEASSNLARYDGVRYGNRVDGDDLISMYENTRAAGFGAEVKRRIMVGTYVLSAGYYDAYYLKAQQVRSLIKKDFTDAFATVDAILTPTAPTAAFGIGENNDDPVAMYLNDVFTVPASLAGMPGVSVPAGLDSSGLPLGLQLIGRPFDEANLLGIAKTLEDAAGFDAAPTAWWRN